MRERKPSWTGAANRPKPLMNRCCQCCSWCVCVCLPVRVCVCVLRVVFVLNLTNFLWVVFYITFCAVFPHTLPFPFSFFTALRFHFVCLFTKNQVCTHFSKCVCVFLLYVCMCVFVCVGCAYFAALCASSEWKPERAARRMRFQSAELSRCLSHSPSFCLSSIPASLCLSLSPFLCLYSCVPKSFQSAGKHAPFPALAVARPSFAPIWNACKLEMSTFVCVIDIVILAALIALLLFLLLFLFLLKLLRSHASRGSRRQRGITKDQHDIHIISDLVICTKCLLLL